VCAAGYGLRAMTAVRQALPALTTSACHPEVRLAVYRSLAWWPVHDVPYQCYQVPERAGLIPVASRRFLQHAHDAGLGVQIWTVDEPDDMARLFRWGVDGVISNRPDVAVHVRASILAGSDDLRNHR
jgi:glycerophosphoryl diester phosphodiesterase